MSPHSPSHQDDLSRYLDASTALDSTQSQLDALAHSDSVTAFHQQMSLLQQHLLQTPQAFRDLFIADGARAIAHEFQQEELTAGFILTFWAWLLQDDDTSKVLMRFVWNLPLKLKRKFIHALDQHLSDRYPMFKGLSQHWPAQSFIPPYIRRPEERANDFELVNQGYLGYLTQGFNQREVDLIVWLEVLRDKQCEERPCEIGLRVAGKDELKGGCPVKIPIPQVLDLMGHGRFREAMALIENSNPLPNVTGRVCPQELQCQGVCAQAKQPIEIGQLEWFLPEREKRLHPEDLHQRFAGFPNPWLRADKPPIAIVGSGPSGLINAYLLAVEGFPVTVFEAFHALGGVLRYGIPEFRLPNALIDDVVAKIKLLGGQFVPNFVVGKTATLHDLQAAGFWKVFVGTGAGLPRFMNVPGEHLLNVMSANEFLTRVNLMQGLRDDYETPLPETRDKQVMVIGGGNTAMDAARTARRLGGHVTIVYRRTQKEMPARVEELHHALEEGILLKELRSPCEFVGDDQTHFVTAALLDMMTLGPADASGRRSPVATGKQERMDTDLVIMALGNDPNPIIKNAEPNLKTTRWGTIELAQKDSMQTSLDGIYSGGDAARGGSTAIRAAGDGQAAAREIVGDIPLTAADISRRVADAAAYTALSTCPPTIISKRELTRGIVEFQVSAPLIARAARPGQFVRVLASPDGELIPLTLADWDVDAGTLCLVIQGVGTSSLHINQMQVGDAFAGIAGPLGRPSELHQYDANRQTLVLTAGGLGLPPVYPIAREHLRLGNHVVLIAGFRHAGQLFWTGEQDRIARLQAEFTDQLQVIYCSNDGSFGQPGLVTAPLEAILKDGKQYQGRNIAEVITIGPSLMMRAVCDLTRPYGIKTLASLNAIMVDATGMCGACMVPVMLDGRLVRKHACVDGPEIDGHLIDWDKFLPRLGLFRSQEIASQEKHRPG